MDLPGLGLTSGGQLTCQAPSMKYLGFVLEIKSGGQRTCQARFSEIVFKTN